MSDEPDVKAIVENFVKKADAYGMPTRVLKAVLAKAQYGTVPNESNPRTTNNGNLISLPVNQWEQLSNASPLNRDSSQFDAVSSIYHESTHSFLWNIGGSDAALAFQAAATHYQYSPLNDGSGLKFSKDGSNLEQGKEVRLFVDEVAGEYVENRIETWWRAFSNIQSAIGNIGKDGGEKVYNRILSFRETYETESRNLFLQPTKVGYIRRGWYFKDELRSTVTMPPDFAAWLDSVILEGKVKRHFDQDPIFKKLIRDAGLPALPPYQEPPAAAPVSVDSNPPRMPGWRIIPTVKLNRRPERNDQFRQRQRQFFDDQRRRNQQLQQLQQQHDRNLREQLRQNERRDLEQRRRREQERLRETWRQQDQRRREQEQKRHRNVPIHGPGHNPFGGAHGTGADRHRGLHTGGPFRGPFPHGPNPHPHQPDHRPHIHKPRTDPFGVGGLHGSWRVSVQNKSGIWTRGPLNKF